MTYISDLYNQEYFGARRRNAILKGRKPFRDKFWIKYIRKIKPKGTLLEVGCAQGFFLEYARKGYDVYGIDVSRFAITQAKERLPCSDLRIMDATDLKFPEKKFDIVVCFDVLEHIVSPVSVLKEVHRTLKNPGLLLISTPNTQSIGKLLKKQKWFGYRDPTHVSLLNKQKWFEKFQEANLEIIDIRFDGLWDSPYLSRLPSFIQHIFFKVPSDVLFYVGFPIPERLGENICIVAQKIKG